MIDCRFSKKIIISRDTTEIMQIRFTCLADWWILGFCFPLVLDSPHSNPNWNFQTLGPMSGLHFSNTTWAWEKHNKILYSSCSIQCWILSVWINWMSFERILFICRNKSQMQWSVKAHVRLNIFLIKFKHGIVEKWSVILRIFFVWVLCFVTSHHRLALAFRVDYPVDGLSLIAYDSFFKGEKTKSK